MSSSARSCVRTFIAAVLGTLVAACAWNRETVVLLPGNDGRAAATTTEERSALSVTKGDREVVLDRPYAAARQSWYGGSQSFTSSAEEVQTSFGNALAAQPRRPKTFTLYFVEGSEEFTAESRQIIDSVFAEIAAYPVPDIVVVGHTDATGSDQYNDALSLRRAETVRTALVGRGVAPENVVAVGRGKREPFRSTPGVLADPINRRVEIVVR